MEKAAKIWLDGKFVEWDEANVHIMTHTLHYGLGVFEGIRCYKTDKGPAVFRLKEHVNRLFDSAKIMKIKIPFTNEEIYSAIKETVRQSGLDGCYIRPIIFLGDNKRGLNCVGINIRAAVAVWPWGAYLGEEALSKGIRVKISSYSRHHINVTMVKAKTCGNYVNSIMAKMEALEEGYDEALLLGVDGTVSEGSGENIFIVRNGKLKTPPATAVLEGITRDCIIKIAEDMGLKVVEQNFTRDELYVSDEAFFSGTAAEITPIREVDGRVIGNNGIGEITKKIQKIYFDAVKGKESRYDKWLDHV
ncbi:MAG: branched-chain amino acid transaminase [Nitrospinota bacterium]